VDIHTTPTPQPSIPPWFTEIVLIASYLRGHGRLEAFAAQAGLVRARFGRCQVLDFLALLFGYAISGERTLQAFFDRLQPFADPFMALFEREALPHRSALSRFLADIDGPAWTPFGRCLRPLRTCRGGLRRRLAASGIGLDSGISYLTSMAPARQHANVNPILLAAGSARVATTPKRVEHAAEHIPVQVVEADPEPPRLRAVSKPRKRRRLRRADTSMSSAEEKARAAWVAGMTIAQLRDAAACRAAPLRSIASCWLPSRHRA
jgi:hypothetical protein